MAKTTEHLIISEILIGTDSANEEFIEIFNPTSEDINLETLPLKLHTINSTGTSNFNKLLSFKQSIIKSNSYFLIASNAYKNKYSDTISPDATYTTDSVVSDGSVYISTSATKDLSVIDLVCWGLSTKCTIPISSPTKKHSLEIKIDDSWQESYLIGGTPGYENFTGDDKEPSPPPPVVYSDKIKINELLPNPTGSFTEEFVEIYNAGDASENLSNWKLMDNDGYTCKFPTMEIAAGQYLEIKKSSFSNCSIALNNSGDEIGLYHPGDLEPVSFIFYDEDAEPNHSWSFDGENWQWTSPPTPGLKNVFDEDSLPIVPPKDSGYIGKLKINEIFPAPKTKNSGKEFVEIINTSTENINLSGMRIEDEKNHKVYFPEKILASGEITYLEGKFELNNITSDTAFLIDKDGTKENPIDLVTYEKPKYDYAYAFDGTTWRWNNILTPGKENEFEKKLKVSIVKIKANPKGKDTDKNNGEEIYLKNTSKKKINLKTWSIATGSKTLYNHPITKDFIIQPGKTKKITRKYSLFTLNNKKGAIELRYPDGEVASRVKYDKKKESVKDDEVYELSGKKWQWDAPPEETLNSESISSPEENPENINPETELEISDEEISLNLGKYSSENKLALAEIKFKSTGENLLQSRETPGIVLGAFSARDKIHTPIEIKSINSWQKTLQKSNQFFNLLINQFVRLI